MIFVDKEQPALPSVLRHCHVKEHGDQSMQISSSFLSSVTLESVD